MKLAKINKLAFGLSLLTVILLAILHNKFGNISLILSTITLGTGYDPFTKKGE